MNDFLKNLDTELWDMLLNSEEKKLIVQKNIANNPDNKNKPYFNKNTKNFNQKKSNFYDSSNDNFSSWKLNYSFPETKFYLPSLREGYTRYIPIWWNNETWAKNMGLVQYSEDIILIDCWLQFADSDMLWANYSIPDIWFLIWYKKNIKWFVITHAHLDHIWALKHVLPLIWYPTLYWTKLTIWIIKKWLEEAWFLDKILCIEVDADSKIPLSIWKFNVEFFRVNHSVPDCAWLYISSPSWTNLLHTWDFKIDFYPAIDKPADLERIADYWKKWVSLLLSDSTWSIRKWFSKSEKDVWETLDNIVKNHHKWRLIIATFSSWISRVQQLIDSAEKHWKTIFLSWRSMVENINIAKELWYIKIKQWIVKKMNIKNTEWILPHNQIIITTWSQGEEFSALARMAEWKHNSIEIVKDDTIVFSSSVVPGNEKSVVWIINKLIKLWANVITKDDWEVHTWWHAFVEEQKIMIKLTKAKYFSPIYWDLYFRTLHKNTAMSIWFKEENILMLENWNIVDFAPNNWEVFKSRIKVPLQQIIIDGHWIWTANSHVIKAREKMMKSWVMVINYKIDKKTKAILWHIKLETRWLVYLEEVRYIHRIVIKKAKEIYENTIKDVPDMEEKDLLKIIKSDLEQFLLKKINREPMIIPIITEI